MDLWNIIRISRWEISRNLPDTSPRGFAKAVAAIAILALIVTAGNGAGAALNDGLYTIGVSEDSPYYEPVSESPVFTIREPSQEALNDGDIVLLVTTNDDGKTVTYVRDTQKGRAALSEFQRVISTRNDDVLRDADNQSAAFPVEVELTYVAADEAVTTPSSGDSGQTGDDSPSGTPTATPTPDDSDGGLFGGGKPLIDAIVPSTAPDTGSNTPGNLSPPFPFKSVVLSLLFLLPLNFVAQGYASNMMSERLRDRGELLLVSPASPGDIIVGKTIPYFLGMMALATVTAIATGGGVLSVAAIAPFALSFLGAVFVASLLARSYKELTFVTVSISVGIISFAFVPAMFTNVHPIALISPLTIVVQELQQAPVTLTEFLFATAPLTITGIGMFLFGSGMYREEDLFRQRPMPAKLLEGLSNWTPRTRSVPVVTAGMIPFVFVAELLILAFLFAFPPQVAIVFLFIGIGIIEEVAKSIHIYAGFTNERFPRTLKNGVKTGVLSGGAFWLVEKFMTITQVVGLQQLDIGQAAFGGPETTPTPVATVLLLLAPLVLHTVTASLSAIGASRSRRWYVVGLTAAIIIHVAYNLTAVVSLG